MRFLVFAAAGICFSGPAHAEPSQTPTESYSRCMAEGRVTRILERGTATRNALTSELERAEPDWPKLRQLRISLWENDILFRKELYRVELMCLDRLSPGDRLSILKRDFGKIQPPPFMPKPAP